jgi:RNA polymerase sigma-70 factor (ECF subfamily)
MPKAVFNRTDSAASRDERCWAALRIGDVAALETLFRAHVGDLCDFSLSYVGSPDAAEEVVHELFCWLWEHRHTLEEPRSVRGYLFTAVRNRSHNHVRAERNRSRFLDRLSSVGRSAMIGSAPPTDGRALAVDLMASVDRSIAALPTRCREVFLLVRRQRMTYAEAAAVLHIAPKTVEIHMGRAMKLLRRSLSAWIDSPN